MEPSEIEAVHKMGATIEWYLYQKFSSISWTLLSTLPDSHQSFMVYHDTSKQGLGCVMMQNYRVIAYASRQSRDPNKNHDTHDIKDSCSSCSLVLEALPYQQRVRYLHRS